MSLLKRITPFLILFLSIQLLVRISLLARSMMESSFTAYEILSMFARGFWLDTATASFFMIPLALYHLALPARKHGSALDKRIDAGWRIAFMFTLLFDAVAEHLFWSEFTTRFNFIAVDYLVYTQEVIGNIVESYPIGWIILAIALAAAALAFAFITFLPLRATPTPLSTRLSACAGAIAVAALCYTASDTTQAQFNDNAEAQEISANGMYNLFAAFWNNEISYDRFYATLPNEKVSSDIQKILDRPYARHFPKAGANVRLIKPAGPELHKNVVIVVMESLSAMYMGAFGSTQNLTPNLDRLSQEGLFFTNFYATGTRTIRGLEAITLSIPPTPGQSLVRRPGNENLYSLGFIFKERGYDTRFIYGGYGYFDNMNNFFAGNGFDIIDRTTMPKDEVNFANVWGIVDDDMFAKLIKEADASYAAKRPFAHLLLTTTNHRPYTYPDGHIDIPSRTSRAGGVKYADYSVGKLIEWAKEKPWFNDTVFIFVSDHTAGAGGKIELDPKKYHIPMIFYAPGFIKPQRYDELASQIDLAPTLLGMLNFSYYTKFYGDDLLQPSKGNPRAFVSNYQKVALVKNNSLLILSPKQGITQYGWPDASQKQPTDQALADEAIAYHQSASWWRDMYRRIHTKAAK